MKTLVAYFSASGITASVAKEVASAANADLYEIKPGVRYTSADLNWMDKKSRSSVEMSNPASRPEIVKDLPDLSQYDTVIIGFPIWWYVAPTIINTFLESGDYSGKKIALFATSGGNGFGKTVQNLKPSVDASAQFVSEKLLNGATPADIKAWVDTLA